MGKEYFENSQFILCEHCLGHGKINDKVCSHCHGLGAGIVYKKKFFYWKNIFTKSTKLKRNFAHKINLISNLLVFLLAISSFAFSIYLLYKKYYLINKLYFFTDFHVYLRYNSVLLYLYLSIFLFLFLYYRKLKEKVDQKNLDKITESLKKNTSIKTAVNSFDEVFYNKYEEIDLSKYLDQSALEVLENAYDLNTSVKLVEIVPLHLFATLIDNTDVQRTLYRLAVNRSVLVQDIVKSLLLLKSVYEKNNIFLKNKREFQYNVNLIKILLYAGLDAMDRSFHKINVFNLFYAIRMVDYSILDYNFLDELFEKHKMYKDKIVNILEWSNMRNRLKLEKEKFWKLARLKPESNMDRAMTAMASPLLERFTKDLTYLAIKNQFLPVLNRDKEIQEIFNLIESSSNAVLLIGQDGVGKTAIIEEIAKKMVMEEVPSAIQDKRLLSLDLASFLSSVPLESQYQALQELFNSLALARNVVLVIENIEILLGNANGAGMNLADILLEAVRKQYFYLITTVNNKNYLDYVESTALNNLFAKVNIDELKSNEAIQVIESRASYFEAKYSVWISYDAIAKLVELTDKYIYDDYLPAKAFKILEETMNLVRKERGEGTLLLAEDIAKKVSEKTQIPLTDISNDESEKLLSLEDNLHKRVIGQDHAVKVISQSLRRARAELRDENRPIVNLLFLGPTGVGKTELAKAVSELYFGAEERMIRFDMSEYQNKNSLARLIGGNREKGLLTEAVRKQAFALLLFDELEKAHPDILNVFLQILDDGRLTDGQGQTVDFSNTIIIATSNAGAQYIQDAVSSGEDIETIKEHLLNNELQKYYRPEFLNRFDDIIVFKPLTYDEIIEITKLMLDKVAKRMLKKQIHLEFTDSAIKEIAKLGYDPKFGARPLKRAVQDYVENNLANYLLTAKIGARDKVIFEEGGKIRVEKISHI